MLEIVIVMSAMVAPEAKDVGKGGAGIPEEIAVKMHEKLSDNFTVGEPVWIPLTSKNMVYGTESDLKYGYYAN